MPDLPAPRRLRALRVAVGLLLAAGVAGLASVGAGTAPRATLLPAGAVLAAPGAPGFDQVSFTVRPGPDLPSPLLAGCALLASTERQRAQGLMGRRSLGRYAGMVFQFPAPTNAAFTMYRTPMPLSIAWFGAGGRLEGERDMAPCPSAVAARCPQYRAPGAYSLALEVPKGQLAGLGIGAGSAISASGPCIG